MGWLETLGVYFLQVLGLKVSGQCAHLIASFWKLSSQFWRLPIVLVLLALWEHNSCLCPCLSKTFCVGFLHDGGLLLLLIGGMVWWWLITDSRPSQPLRRVWKLKLPLQLQPHCLTHAPRLAEAELLLPLGPCLFGMPFSLPVLHIFSILRPIVSSAGSSLFSTGSPFSPILFLSCSTRN